ncbi:hypothetical protein, partial [Psychrobacillus soli]|uniref:hypothetical protein n=1 Tax=Psychrobacillus soli TaxID=1543965 RepID=UPI00163D1174
QSSMLNENSEMRPTSIIIPIATFRKIRNFTHPVIGNTSDDEDAESNHQVEAVTEQESISLPEYNVEDILETNDAEKIVVDLEPPHPSMLNENSEVH